MKNYFKSIFVIIRLLLSNLGLICFLIRISRIYTLDINESGNISIPFILASPIGSSQTVTFNYSVLDKSQKNRLEFVVSSFCEVHNLRSNQCKILFDIAYKELRRSSYLLLRSVSEYADFSQISSGEFINNLENMGTNVLGINNLMRYARAVENKIRYETMVSAQQGNDSITIRKLFVLTEKAVLDILKSKILQLSSNSPIERVVSIHSASLNAHPNSDNRILTSLLLSLQESGLYKEADMIIVFNYGTPYTEDLVNRFNDVLFVQVSEDAVLFELGTVRIIQSIATLLPPTAAILYLHTLGASYSQQYQSIEDWRSMMTYFLVTRHRSCFHILRSGEFDIVGVNYRSTEGLDRYLDGNFWWVTADYLSSLPLLNIFGGPIALRNLLFGALKTRVYLPHSSHISDHRRERYPEYCYVSLPGKEAPSREQWLSECREPVMDPSSPLQHQLDQEYKSLHAPHSLPAAPYSSEKVARASTGRCHSLHLEYVVAVQK